MKYLTLDNELIGEIKSAGNYCWTCKLLIPSKATGCSKCKTTIDKRKLEQDQTPGGGIYESNEIYWEIDPTKVMSGRIWYVKDETNKIIPVGYFRDLVNNTCALQHYQKETKHNDTLERSKRKVYDGSHIKDSPPEEPKPEKRKKWKPEKEPKEAVDKELFE